MDEHERKINAWIDAIKMGCYIHCEKITPVMYDMFLANSEMFKRIHELEDIVRNKLEAKGCSAGISGRL